MTSNIGRIFFYALLIYGSCKLTANVGVNVQGDAGSILFGAIAGVFGVIQALNMWIIGKLTEVQEKAKISLWAKKRLRRNLENRRGAVMARLIIGFGAANALAIIAAYMRFEFEQADVPNNTLGVAIGLSFITFLTVVISFVDFYMLSKLEAQIKFQASNNEAAEKFKLTLTKEEKAG